MPENLTKLFHSTLEQEAGAALDELLAKRIRDRLVGQGVDADSFPIDALIRHIRSDSVDDFVWEGTDEQQAVTLDLHDAADEILGLADSVDMDELLSSFAEQYASSVLAALMEDWPEQRIREDQDLSGFRERLVLLWNQPLTLFRMLLTCSAECFDEYAAALERPKERTEGDYVREALFYVHGRLLRTATAVRILLEHGLADEAYARCRTLYELYVVGSFISHYGDEAGRRYLDHDAVMLWKGLKREIEWGAEAVPESIRGHAEANARAAVQEHGESFGHPYGWASKFLKNRHGDLIERPRIEQLARATLSNDRPQGHPPFYGDSSLQVHAGITGAIGLAAGGEGILATGHSNHGLEQPLITASGYIAAASGLLQAHLPSPDPLQKLVYAETLARLAERTAEEAMECAEEVERETLRRKKLREKS